MISPAWRSRAWHGHRVILLRCVDISARRRRQEWAAGATAVHTLEAIDSSKGETVLIHGAA
ncbi:hypothetical protein C4J65_32015 [Streptomyces sp. CB09001]|nr:hypothetical protein C4J65_32015 [Streptomyces sp. CB09001]